MGTRLEDFDVVQGRLVGAADKRAYTVRVDESLRWQEAAACRAQNADTYFPEGRPALAPRRVCNEVCPVREACLEFALAHDEHGIWGGLTEPERQRLKRSRVMTTRGSK